MPLAILNTPASALSRLTLTWSAASARAAAPAVMPEKAICALLKRLVAWPMAVTKRSRLQLFSVSLSVLAWVMARAASVAKLFSR